MMISTVQMNIKVYCAFHDISEILVDRTVLVLFRFSITNLTETSLGLNSGLRQKPANNHPKYFDIRFPQHLQDVENETRIIEASVNCLDYFHKLSLFGQSSGSLYDRY